MRQRRFFSVQVRQTISEFGVVISIVLMVLLDYFMGFETPKLHVPSKLSPTRSDRGWFISPFDKNPVWSIGLAVPFALMGTILIFMDQQITAVIVNRRENKLVKGVGYHLDLFICSIALILCSIFGLPWFIGRSLLFRKSIILIFSGYSVINHPRECAKKRIASKNSWRTRYICWLCRTASNRLLNIFVYR